MVSLQIAEYALSYPYNMQVDRRVVDLIDKQLLSLQGVKEFEALLNKYFGSGAKGKDIESLIGSVVGAE